MYDDFVQRYLDRVLGERFYCAKPILEKLNMLHDHFYHRRLNIFNI